VASTNTRQCSDTLSLPTDPGFDIVAVLNKFIPERHTENLEGRITYCLSYNHTTNTISFRMEWEDDLGIASYPKSSSFFKALLVNSDPNNTEVLIMDKGGFFSIKGVMNPSDGKIKGEFRFVNLPSLSRIVHWASESEIDKCVNQDAQDNSSVSYPGFYKNTSNAITRCATSFNIPLEAWDSNLNTDAIDFAWNTSSLQYRNLIAIVRNYLTASLATSLLSLNIEQYKLGLFSHNPL
jgi:hypothetical protein